MAGIISAVICIAAAAVSRGRSLKRAVPIILITATSVVIMVIWLKFTRYRIPAPDINWFAPIWLLNFERQTMWLYAWDLVKRPSWIGLGINTIKFVPGNEKKTCGEPQPPL